MRRARKYLVKPIVKKRLGHDLLLPGPPRSRIRGHSSSCEPPLFLDYRRKNSARVEYSKLLRERYRQIDMETKKQTRQLPRLRRLPEAAVEAEAMNVHRTIQAAATEAESQKGENVTATRVFAAGEAKNAVAAETTKDNSDVMTSDRAFFSIDAKRTKDAVFLSDVIVGRGTNDAKAALVLGFDFEPLPSHKKTPTKKSTRTVDSVKSLPTGAVSKTTTTPPPPQKERVKAASKSKTKGTPPPPSPPSVSTSSGTPPRAASNITRSKHAATVDTKTTVAATATSSAATARAFANADSIETTAANVSATTRKSDKLTGGDYVENYTTPPGKRWTLTQAAPAHSSDTSTTSSCDDEYGGRREGSEVSSTWKPTRRPFSNPIVFPPAKLSASLSPNKRAEFMEREARLQRAWRRVIQRISKTVPIPMRWPSNMKQPPALFFEQTRTFELRRHLRHRQHTAATVTLETGKKSPTLVRKSLKYTEPRKNLTQTLRYRQLKRQPIMSEFFEKFYSKYGKPPFKLCVNSFG